MISREKAYKLRAKIEKAAISLSDEDALEAIELFPSWAAGNTYEQFKRLRYRGRLYRVKQLHTSQEEWTPDIAVSLYEEVAEPGQGETPDNPIPYNNNMELFEGKYYSQNGLVYLCTRNTGTTVYNDLADLVGLYVEVYTGG